MNWDAVTGIAAFLIPAIGGVMGYATLRARFDAKSGEHDRRLDASEDDRRDLRNRLDQIDRAAVRVDMMDRVEDRLGERIEKVEHAVRNTATQIIGALSGRRMPDKLP